MAYVVPDASETAVLQTAINAGNLKLKLFKNNATITSSTVLSDLTESTYTGYSAKTLTSGSFTVSSSSGTAQAVYANQTFACTSGSESVYGAFITDSAGTTLWGVQKFATALTISPGNDIILPVKLTMASVN